MTENSMPEGRPLPSHWVPGPITTASTRPAAVPVADSSLEPDRQAMERMGRQAVEYIADLHHRPHGTQSNGVSFDADARRAALLSPPPSGPTDFTTVLNTFAAAANTGTLSPTAFDHIPNGALYTSVIAGFLAQGVNPFTALAAEAPELVAMEQSVLLWLCREFGLPMDTAGGVITTGGSVAGLTALVAARCERLGEHIAAGTLYATAHTHHSLIKAARIAGLPADAVRVVPVDPDLRMDLAAAEAMICADRVAGWKPFLIIGNAGSTDTGTVDPLAGIADVAARYGLWFHVDGAYGGVFQLTNRGRDRLAGIERADSIVVDPHKGFSVPFGTGVLLVARTESLRAAYAMSGPYLRDVAVDPQLPDYSALGVELTREFRGLRLWLPLHVHGTDSFRVSLNEKLDLARAAYQDLFADPCLHLPWTPDLSTVVFRLRSGDTRRCLDRINAHSPVALSGTTIGGRDLIRLCVLSHRSHTEHVGQALDTIHSAARSRPTAD
jgi:aromatic-L-amino-acid decarboxylase